MFDCANSNVKSIIIVIKMNLKNVSPRHVEFIHRNKYLLHTKFTKYKVHKSLDQRGLSDLMRVNILASRSLPLLLRNLTIYYIYVVLHKICSMLWTLT